jgi:predicted aspartyl protease
MRRSCLFALLSIAIPIASAHGVAQTSEAVLAANREAMAPTPAKGMVRVRYDYSASGLKGTATHLFDLATGGFVDEVTADPISQTTGFDGKTPWMRDVSGATITQEGGDRIPVAVNEAYRNANRWWAPDRGGAQIAYVGRESISGKSYDHLAVTPRGGSRFEAWFDADTHLLMRTAEPQLFFKTRATYSEYRKAGDVMLAGRRTIDFGTGPSNIETMQLIDATREPERPMADYSRPTAPPPGGVLVDGATSETLPFRLLNNHIYVEASVNGKGPYTFLVDTGGHTLLSSRIVKEVGLESVGKSATSGAGEKTSTTGFAKYRQIALGKVQLRDQTAFATEIYDPAIEGIRVDGMVGFELFRRFVVRLDYGAQTMTVIDAARFDPRDAGTAVPFKFYDHLPYVQGFIDDLPARFDIDTGSRSEIDITSPYVARHKLRDKYAKGVSTITGWGVGGASRSYVVRIASLTLGTVKMQSVVAGLSQDKGGSISDANYDGNVGSGFLKRFVVTFDYAHQMMYLKPLDPQPIDAGRFDHSGMWINAGKDAYVVTSVAAGSPAALAGLAEGDEITALAGKPAVAEHLSDARTLLRALPAGTDVAVTYRRKGTEQHATIKLRDQI